ncbi:MAG: YybS family protein [Nitrospinae bacterium]|nr:YybS family protein [Nitrospinota bacterium]
METNKFARIDNVYFQVLLTVILFLPFYYLPIAGKVISLFAAVPVIFSSLYFGIRKASVVGILSFIIVAAIIQRYNAVFFLFEVAIVGVVMGELIKMRLTFEKVILGTALISTVAALLIFTMSGGGEGFEATLATEIQQAVKESVKVYESANVDKEIISNFKELTATIVKVTIMAIPALLGVSLLLSAFISYYATKLFWKIKLSGEEDGFDTRPVSSFKLPDKLVWFFIASCLLLYIGDEFFMKLAINGLIICFALYFIQGLALIHFFFMKKNVPAFFRYMFYFFIAFQPALAFFVAGMGLFDVWLDSRKLEKPPGNNNSDNNNNFN